MNRGAVAGVAADVRSGSFSPFRFGRAMSDLPSTPTVCRASDIGSDVPKPTAPSFNHVVGAGDQQWRQFDPKRLCGLQIDAQLELCRLENGDIVWFRPFKDFVG